MNMTKASRQSGLSIMTAIATAAIQNTAWSGEFKMFSTFLAILVGAFFVFMAAEEEKS